MEGRCMDYNIWADLKRQKNIVKELQDLIDKQEKYCESEPDSFAFELTLQSLHAQKDSILNKINELERMKRS